MRLYPFVTPKANKYFLFKSILCINNMSFWRPTCAAPTSLWILLMINPVLFKQIIRPISCSLTHSPGGIVQQCAHSSVSAASVPLCQRPAAGPEQVTFCQLEPSEWTVLQRRRATATLLLSVRPLLCCLQLCIFCEIRSRPAYLFQRQTKRPLTCPRTARFHSNLPCATGSE